ncbi:hypothetical protein J8M21_11340 [Pseudoalteromonas luteoviolacea]|uniref:hypothetical protein n=1 Tax=Pseudoalteromonas luteoviolacea TaxID=43657 RepID=UPI001B3A0900|nr:hypothetical protein [Pseudoalteromonas luteoviolacea]MBQ4877800.1 hypothetical protein [Pseudoalteromonas luteoviolacea]MBQ4906754.1 hypothetical protein [Pseudoalteromonas luteoviolacea]
MRYFDLPELSSDLLQKLGVKDLRKIPINPAIDAKPFNCLSNVNSYIELYGGSVQFGWIFSCLGHIAVKMTAHAVVKSPDSSLMCITPNEYRAELLKFAPDDSVEKLVHGGFLPTKIKGLIDNEPLNKYIDIEKELDKLRLNSKGVVPQIEIQRLKDKGAELYPAILSLAKRHTGRNNQCYCGSGKKRKKCCN